MIDKRVLKKCEVFSALRDAELEQVASLAQEKQYEAGMTIFEGGDSADELLVLQEGKVALQMTLLKEHGQMSRSVSIDIVSTNEIVGWSAIVEPYTYTFTAVCLQKIKALSISGHQLRRLLQDDPRIGYEVLKGLIKVVASRLQETRHLLISERSFTSLK